MTRFYFTDPLKAAIMCQEFRFTYVDEKGERYGTPSMVLMDYHKPRPQHHLIANPDLLEPQKGDRYLFTAEQVGKKPKYGTQLYIFHERKYRGCQLHGDLLGYEYWFKVKESDDFASASVFVKYDDNDQFHKKPLQPVVLDTLGFPMLRNGKPFFAPESEAA